MSGAAAPRFPAADLGGHHSFPTARCLTLGMARAMPLRLSTRGEVFTRQVWPPFEVSTLCVTITRKQKHPTRPWLWTHFCFRGLWEDEMFARQVLWGASASVWWLQKVWKPLGGRLRPRV